MQVAERSLFLWNHEYIITLVAQYRQVCSGAAGHRVGCVG